MWLHRPSSIRVVIKQQSHPCLLWLNLWRIAQFITDLAHLSHRLRLLAVRAQQASMHLFLRHRRLPPTEITDRLGPMGKGLPRPKPHHTGQGRWIIRRPVHWTGLLFHHPPTAPANGAIKIMVEGLKIGITLPRERFLMRGVGPHTILKKAHGIAIPTGDLEIITNLEMIEIRDAPHVIMRHRSLGMRLDNVRLHPVKRDHLIRGIAPESEAMRRVWLCHSEVRQADLIKAIVFHRPEHIAPHLIQRLNCAIAVRQPGLKPVARCIGIGNRRVVTAVFIVRLPRCNVRVRAISFGQQLNDPGAFFAVRQMRKAIMSPRPEPSWFAIHIQRDHVRVFVHHPTRRRRSRRTQNHFQTCCSEGFNRLIQPFKPQIVRRRFQPRPRKFSDPNPRQTRLDHPARVVCPDLWLPVFGIIASAQSAFHQMLTR